MDEKIFLPVLHSFENGNVFTGSYGMLRFKITPHITMKTQKEVDFENSTMDCEVWYGMLCYEKSEIVDKKNFALSTGHAARCASGWKNTFGKKVRIYEL